MITPLLQQSHEDQVKIVQDALYRIREVNAMPSTVSRSLISFQVDGEPLGKVTPAMAQRLVNGATKNPVFELVAPKQSMAQPYLTLSESCGKTCEERSAAVAAVMEQLHEIGVIRGWRNELYPVSSSFYNQPVFLIERAAANFLGVLEYGVHVNGLVKGDNDKETKMWMARRSATKSKYAGMLDHIVAGGQPAGLSLLENVVKECQEEAGIPPALTRAGIRPTGVVSYETYSDRTESISRCVLFNFDLELPANFVPAAVDGEVEEFFLWSVEEILASLDPSFPDPIKPNCYAVIIDWLVREGHLSPDVPGYLDVVKELKGGDCK